MKTGPFGPNVRQEQDSNPGFPHPCPETSKVNEGSSQLRKIAEPGYLVGFPNGKAQTRTGVVEYDDFPYLHMFSALCFDVARISNAADSPQQIQTVNSYSKIPQKTL